MMEDHTHDFSDDEWPFNDPQNLAVFTTIRVLEGAPVLLVTHDHDGDWQVLCGTTNDSKDARIVCFGCAYQRNRVIGELADLPRGWRAWRDDVKSPWIREMKELEDEEDQDES
jgi:hypothetical protein